MQTSTATKSVLLGATCIAALTLFGPTAALAQDAQESGSEVISQPSEVERTSGGEQIIVTGTRIRTTQYDFANPVVAVGQEAIQNSGVTNLTDFLAENPALTGSYNSNDGSGANAGIGGVGLNLLDLRNLGTQRTLVLIDGRRHVAALPGDSSVDVNTIPIDLIKRVDVVTGGASAIYGADAVTGVVNFVTVRDFEGLTARAQSGISRKGDNASQFFSITAGKNFGGGRGNIALNFEYGHDDRFALSQRSEFGPSFRSFQENPDDGPNSPSGVDDPNVPDNLLFADTRFRDSHPASAIDTDFDFLPNYYGNGIPFTQGTFVGGFIDSGGDGTPTSTYSGEILPKIDRYIGNLLASYEVSDGVTLFAQGKYARVNSKSFGEPTFDFFIGVPTDNPFIAQNVLDENDATGFGFLGIVLVTGRDNLDLGRRGETNRRETYRGVLGLEAELSSNIKLEASYVYGQSDVAVRQTNTRYNDRFFAALDAVDEGEFLTGTPNGNIVCRSNLTGDATSSSQYVTEVFFFEDFDELSFTPGPNSGCVPINLFNDGQSQAALDWVNTTAVDRSSIKQHVASVSINGDLGDFKLGGGPIGFAVGGEYRKEQSASFPDPVNTTGLTFGNALFPEVGSFDVLEGFAEVRVPLLQDRPGFHDLTLNGAARVSKYSTVDTTFTYQAGLVYAPVKDIRFRGTYAQAVRAPNIGELFGPQNQDFRSIADPCAPQRINNGSSTRAANCLQLLQNAGLSPAQIAAFTGATPATVGGLSGGNPDLGEETAKTITAGVILQPSFIPNLVLSADYYDVKIEDAVSTPTVTTIANLCVDAPTIDNSFCPLITRLPGTAFSNPGTIGSFVRQPLNVAFFRTKGIDFSAQYSIPTDKAGLFSVGMVGNWLDTLITTSVPGATPVENAGTNRVPEWQVNFDLNWTYKNLNLNYGFNYFSKTLRFSRATVAANPDIVAPEYLKNDAKFEHDIQLRWTTDNNMSFYVGVDNIFNQRPDVGENFYPVSAVGRFMYAGVRIKLDDIPGF